MTDSNKKLTGRIELRPVIMPDDDDFLKALYFTSREDAHLLPEEIKEAFLTMQYTAQKAHYEEHFNIAWHYIVMYDGQAIGRYWVDYRDDEIRLIDIALLPEYRGIGIGSIILKDTMKEAAETSRPYTLHAMQEGRSVKFYEKLGFHIVGEAGMHHLMEWKPLETK